MIVPREKWQAHAAEPGTLGATVVVEFPCHTSILMARWVLDDGSVTGRPQCTASGCRRTYDAVTLDGWDA